MRATNPLELVHTQAQPGEPSPKPELGLHWLDQLAIKRLVSTDVTEVVEYARALAGTLAGSDSDAARLRLLARAIATARTQQALLEAMLLERLAKRDDAGVEAIDKALRSVTARLIKLVEAHRLESAAAQRPSVVVAHADTVNVDGGG